MKSFISFSGGVESSAMCLLFGNKADAIFADTQWEHDDMYKRLPLVESAVRAFHGNDFKIHLVSKGSLPEYIREQKFYPNFQARFCTRMFKIEPIDNFLKQFKDEGAEILIGLNADEEDLRTGNHGLLKFVKYSYPLVDNGITRSMCIDILKAAGIYPDFKPFMKRGGCKGCYFKGRGEYRAMAVINEKEYDEVMELEEAIQDVRGKFFAPTNVREGLRRFKEVIKSQPSIFPPDEEYGVINTATKCGVFCNR
jgi:hypothetical protein